MIAKTREPGASVSLVARRHGVAPNQLFTWRRLRWLRRKPRKRPIRPRLSVRDRSKSANCGAFPGKKTLEVESLKEALEVAGGSKNVSLIAQEQFPMTAVCRTASYVAKME